MLVGKTLEIKEIGVPIEGFEDKYLIFSDGRVFGIKRKAFLKTRMTNKGYPMVCFYKGSHPNRVRVRRTIHSLVAEHFISRRPDGMEVNHKDHNRLNPNVSNLEWVTHSENIKKSFCFPRKRPVRLLSEENVRDIRDKYPTYNIPYFCLKFNVSPGTIWQVIKKTTYAEIV